MTTGIYRLNFTSGNFYIGKSVDMEVRWQQHLDKMQKGEAAKPMQIEYNRSGPFDPRIVFTCHYDYLDILEGIAINHFWGPSILNTNRPPARTQLEIDAMMHDTTQTIILGHTVPILVSSYLEINEELTKLKEEGIVLPENIDAIKLENRALRKRLEAYTDLGLFSRIFNYPKFRDLDTILKHFSCG